MKTVIVNKNRELVDNIVERPIPKPYDLLVKIDALSVNPIDLKRIHRITAADSRVLGYDALGEVVQIGSSVTDFHVGDHVFYAGDTARDGSYAEYQLVDARIASLAPKTIAAEQAVAMPLTWLTAYEILVDKLHYLPQKNMNKGTLLIINGAGGAGSSFTQLAHWMGLTVLATSSPRNFDWLTTHGTDVPIDYHEDIASQLEKAGYSEVDHVINLFNTVDYFEIAIQLVRPFGHIVNVAQASQPLDMNKLQAKSISFDWELMFTKPNLTIDLESQGKALELLSHLLDNGDIKSTTTKVFSGTLTAELIKTVHNELARSTTVGKLVISYNKEEANEL
ncbi:MAG: zinc-binding alcohol dehydrogenase family protein [Enterococcus sp.]